MGLKPKSKGLKPSGTSKPSTAKPVGSGIKLGLTAKTTVVETLQGNFVTWNDMEDGQSLVFELTNGEFIKRQSDQNKNWVFENFYTWKVVVVDVNEEVVKVIEAESADKLIQIPCQQSHRQGIADLIEMGESVAMFSNHSTNVVNGTTYHNCSVSALDLDNLDAYEA